MLLNGKCGQIVTYCVISKYQIKYHKAWLPQVLSRPVFEYILGNFFWSSHLIFCAEVTVLDFINLLSSPGRQINFSHPRLLHTQMPDKSFSRFSQNQHLYCFNKDVQELQNLNTISHSSADNHLFQRDDKCPEFSRPWIGDHGKAWAALPTWGQNYCQLFLKASFSPGPGV